MTPSLAHALQWAIIIAGVLVMFIRAKKHPAVR